MFSPAGSANYRGGSNYKDLGLEIVSSKSGTALNTNVQTIAASTVVARSAIEMDPKSTSPPTEESRNLSMKMDPLKYRLTRLF